MINMGQKRNACGIVVEILADNSHLEVRKGTLKPNVKMGIHVVVSRGFQMPDFGRSGGKILGLLYQNFRYYLNVPVK